MTLSFTHKHEPLLYRELLYSRHSKFIHRNDGCVWIETVKILTLKYQNKKEEYLQIQKATLISWNQWYLFIIRQTRLHIV